MFPEPSRFLCSAGLHMPLGVISPDVTSRRADQSTMQTNIWLMSCSPTASGRCICLVDGAYRGVMPGLFSAEGRAV